MKRIIATVSLTLALLAVVITSTAVSSAALQDPQPQAWCDRNLGQGCW